MQAACQGLRRQEGPERKYLKSLSAKNLLNRGLAAHFMTEWAMSCSEFPVQRASGLRRMATLVIAR